MKNWVITALATLMLTACGGEEKAQMAGQQDATPAADNKVAQAPAQAGVDPTDKAGLTAEAKEAVKALGGTLKAELQAAMKEGGPVNALGVCNTRAPEIAQSISSQQGLNVSRVSLKNRNPVMGKANDWQSAVLSDFNQRKLKGEPAGEIEYAEIKDNEFRYMKAIPTDALCLSCHGESISPAVISKLEELYPDDKATGYREGDLRGAFVVVKQLGQ